MCKIVAVCVFVVLCAPAWGSNCNIGEYAKDDDCVACPGGYPYSVPNAASANDCYLITDAGKYVAAAGAPESMCPENYYCPGAAPVFYDLKDRFQPIEYLKSTGTQYIDTGIVLGSDVDTKMVFENGRVGGDQALFGVYGANKSYWLNGYNNKAYIRYNEYRPVAESKGVLPVDVKLVLEIKHGDWILDGKTIYSNSGEFTTGRSGYLFAFNREDDGNKWPHKSLKVYSFVQWRNGTEVINLIPVYDSVRDECGMFDVLSGKFFVNIGTGKFECGPVTENVVGPDGAASCAAATDNVAPYSPHGSEDAADCGRVLLFSGNYKLYLRPVSRTTHSLKVKFGDKIFYGDSTDYECGRLRVMYDGKTMSVCNMDADI